MEYRHEAILCIVNAGYSDMVMDVAREHGARGGTVLGARGTANPQAEKIFNISIQPQKEIVLILVESIIKDAVLHGLYQKVGLQSPGQGIAFCLPVEDVVGITQRDFVTTIVEKNISPETTMAKAPREEVEDTSTPESLAADKAALLAELAELNARSKK